MKRIVSLCGMLLLLPPAARAQEEPDSVKQRNECRLAEHVLSTGNPAPHLEWARQYIGLCGTKRWGTATAADVRRLRASRELDELKAAWGPLYTLEDAHLFEAAMEIAGDKSASVPARLHAFIQLAMLRSPRVAITYEQMAGGAAGPGGAQVRCRRYTVHNDKPYRGTPLPADYKERIQALASRVRGDASEPEQIRFAARCT